MDDTKTMRKKRCKAKRKDDEGEDIDEIVLDLVDMLDEEENKEEDCKKDNKEEEEEGKTQRVQEQEEVVEEKDKEK
eukprot:12338552-Ditylum_brightwellii.AAC.1